MSKSFCLSSDDECTVVKKRKLTARNVQNIFSLFSGVNSFWQKELSHYHRENLIYKSCAINFLFF